MEEYRQRHREAYERRLAEQHAREERERQQQQEGTAAADEEESRRSASAAGGQSFLSEAGVASVSSPPIDCSTRTSGDGCSGDGSCSTAGRLQDVKMDTAAAAADAATVAAETAAEAASLEEARRLQRQFEAELEGVRPPDDTYQERLIGEDGPAATMLSWWSQAAQLPLDRLGGREATSAAATTAGGSAAAAAGRAARREAKAINRHLSRPGGAHASASAAEQSYTSSSSSSRQLTAGVTAASVQENFNTGGVPEAAWERELLEQQHQLMNEQQQSPHAEEEGGDAALARRLQVEELRRGRPQQQASIRRSRSPADQAPVSSSSDVSDVAIIDSCPAADALAGCVLNPLVAHASDALESSYTSAEGSGAVSPPRSVATPSTLTTAARVLPGGRGAAATSAQRPENVEAGDAHDVIVIDDPENPSSADENSRGHEALAPPPVQRSTFAFSVPPFPAAPPAATSFTPEQCLHEHANIVPGTSSLVPVDPEDEAAAAAAAAGIDVDSEEAILQAAIAQSLVDM